MTSRQECAALTWEHGEDDLKHGPHCWSNYMGRQSMMEVPCTRCRESTEATTPYTLTKPIAYSLDHCLSAEPHSQQQILRAERYCRHTLGPQWPHVMALQQSQHAAEPLASHRRHAKNASSGGSTSPCSSWGRCAGAASTPCAAAASSPSAAGSNQRRRASSPGCCPTGGRLCAGCHQRA